MSPLLAIAMFAGLAVMSGAIWLINGWAGITVAVVGGLVALIAAGSLGFFMWGKQIGFNWHFTP